MNLNHVWIDNNILIEIKGTLSFQVLLETNALLFSNPRFDHLNYQILNFLDIENIELTTQEIKAYSLLHKAAVRWNPRVKVAVVAIEPEVLECFGNYRSVMKDTPWECEIFDSVKKAHDWCLRFNYKIVNQ